MTKIHGVCLCGSMKWVFEGPLESTTACNCTACRRYGGLWAYGHEGEEIETSGSTSAYFRGDKSLGFHFCSTCGCIGYWRGSTLNDKGQRRIAVNLRLAEQPDQVASLLINHFDGLITFSRLPRDGKCVSDMWF